MLKDTKFRVWVEDEKLFYFPSVFSIDLLNNIILFDWMGRSFIVDGLENLHQFTGFLDIKGEEIYENDIVKYDTIYTDDNEKYEGISIVKNKGCIFDPFPIHEDNIQNSQFSYYNTKYKIVGNINQNPELLN